MKKHFTREFIYEEKYGSSKQKGCAAMVEANHQMMNEQRKSMVTAHEAQQAQFAREQADAAQTLLDVTNTLNSRMNEGNEQENTTKPRKRNHKRLCIFKNKLHSTTTEEAVETVVVAVMTKTTPTRRQPPNAHN